MKQLRYCLLILVVILGCRVGAASQTDKWGTVTNSVQFSIGLNGEQSKLEPNGPVTLVLRCRTLSTNVFYFNSCYGEKFSPGFECTVMTPSTNEVKLDLTVPVGVYAKGHTINIFPNGISQTGLSLGRVFKFDEVGTYKIVAHLTLVPGNQKPFIVTSNPLSFEIRPAQTRP